MIMGGGNDRETDRKNQKQSYDFDGIMLFHPNPGVFHIVIPGIRGFLLCFVSTLPPGSYIHDAGNEILFP